MPVICTEGIVTRYANYRENDRILSIFTIQHGRLDAKARGCRKPQSPLVNACQPFVFGQFDGQPITDHAHRKRVERQHGQAGVDLQGRDGRAEGHAQ